MDTQELISFYDAFSQTYEEVIARDKDYTAFEKIPSWMLPLMAPHCSVLDLGCGTGLGSAPFIKEGYEVTGIDISPKMIEKASRLPFKDLLCQSLETAIPFPSHHFEGVLLLGVLEFIHKPESLFAEVARVLKPNGLFGVTFPEATEKERDILSYTPEQIEDLIANFTCVHHERFQGFIYEGNTVTYQGYLLRK